LEVRIILVINDNIGVTKMSENGTNTFACAKQLAGQNFKEGYNCAEAILQAFRSEMPEELSADFFKIASGFGGGIGHAGCMCGALTGSIMVLSLLFGRVSNKESKESKEKIYQLSEEFHGNFKEKFGATCCRVLNPHSFNSKDHLRNCLKITGGTAELLSEYICKQKTSNNP
jgi:C_GCAxxG_C_C family probable redox protein